MSIYAVAGLIVGVAGAAFAMFIVKMAAREVWEVKHNKRPLVENTEPPVQIPRSTGELVHR